MKMSKRALKHQAYLLHHKRHCDACGELGRTGGMLLQPGRVWVHVACATPHTKWGVEQARIRKLARAWQRKHVGNPSEPWAEKIHRRVA